MPYEFLLNYFDLTQVRELEDIIIEACYHGVIQGKLDQQERVVQVQFAIGRDVRPSDMPDLILSLSKWRAVCSSVLDGIDRAILEANQAALANRKEQHDFRIQFEQLRDATKAGREVGVSPDGSDRPAPSDLYSSIEYYEEDSRSRVYRGHSTRHR